MAGRMMAVRFTSWHRDPPSKSSAKTIRIRPFLAVLCLCLVGLTTAGPRVLAAGSSCKWDTRMTDHTPAEISHCLRAGADPNARFDHYNRTPLHLATSPSGTPHPAFQAGRREIVATLLAAGADPNARDDNGETPLHLAAAFGSSLMISALLEAGADPTTRDAEGRTPLHAPAVLTA